MKAKKHFDFATNYQKNPLQVLNFVNVELNCIAAIKRAGKVMH